MGSADAPHTATTVAQTTSTSGSSTQGRLHNRRRPCPTCPISDTIASAGLTGPLPATSQHNFYILLITGRFSRRTDILANIYIPLRGRPRTITSDNGLQFCSKLSLPPARYTTSIGALRGPWCLQAHIASVLSRGTQRNVEKYRGTAVESTLSYRRHPRSFPVFMDFGAGRVSFKALE